MRYVLPFLALLLLFSSCRPETKEQPVNQYYLKYKANGQAIEHTGAYDMNQPNGVFATRATTVIGTGGQVSRRININGLTGAKDNATLSIMADSVKTSQTYVLTESSTNGWASIRINAKQYQTWYFAVPTNYYMTITILEHSAGWISGTFNGKLGYQNNGSWEDLTVTEGTFKTKVSYY